MHGRSSYNTSGNINLMKVAIHKSKLSGISEGICSDAPVIYCKGDSATHTLLPFNFKSERLHLKPFKTVLISFFFSYIADRAQFIKILR